LIIFRFDLVRKMELADLAIAAAILFLVFGYDSAKKIIAPSDFERKRQNWEAYYRVYGKDNARGADIIKELRQRGLVNIPELAGDGSDYAAMGELEALLDTTKPIPPQVSPQETLFPLVKTFPDITFARVPDGDDA